MNVRLVVDDRAEWQMQIHRTDEIVILTRSTHLKIAQALVAALDDQPEDQTPA